MFKMDECNYEFIEHYNIVNSICLAVKKYQDLSLKKYYFSCIAFIGNFMQEKSPLLKCYYVL